MHSLLLALALAAPNHLHVGPRFTTPAAPEVTGTVVDSAGKPIPEARVTLIELKRISSTTPEGRFVFPAVAPGQYHLSISAIGFAPTVEPLVVTDRDTLCNYPAEAIGGRVAGAAGHRQPQRHHAAQLAAARQRAEPGRAASGAGALAG